MANLHILTRDGDEFNVVAHVPVPNTNNSAGVNWRTALLRSGLGGTTRLPDGDGTGGTISAAEKASITTGAVYEVQTTIKPNQPDQQANDAFLGAEYIKIRDITQYDLQAELKWFGKVGG